MTDTTRWAEFTREELGALLYSLTHEDGCVWEPTEEFYPDEFHMAEQIRAHLGVDW